MKTYKRSELFDVSVEIHDVSLDNDTKTTMEIIYLPREYCKKKCSICGNNKFIFCITGKTILGNRGMDLKTDDDFYVYCKECATAEKI